MTTINTCVYCQETKPVTLFDEELVCKDCRIDFIEQEFEEPKEKLTFQDICDDLGVPNFTIVRS